MDLKLKTAPFVKRKPAARVRVEKSRDSSNYSGGYLTAEQLSDLLSNTDEGEDLFFQVFVPTDSGEYPLYLDTTTLQLHYGPPVPSVIDPRMNYSSIFIIKKGPDTGSFEIFNYVASGNGPMAMKSSATTYAIKLNTAKGYDFVYIKDKKGTPYTPGLAYVSMSIEKDGDTVMWCPTNRNSSIPAERAIQGEAGVSKSSFSETAFLIRPIPKSIPIPHPIKEDEVVPP